MWSFISRLVLRLAAVRWLFKLGGLGLLIPLALVLKTIGLPLLGILLVVGLPILALLFLFGLPIILVMIFGGLLMGFIGTLLSIGVVVLKFAVLFVLPAWLIWKLACALFGKKCNKPRRDDDGRHDDDHHDGDAHGSDIHDGPPPASGASNADMPIDPLSDPLD